jgi:hypothetical protein
MGQENESSLQSNTNRHERRVVGSLPLLLIRRRLRVVYFVLQRSFEQSQCFMLDSKRAKLVVAEDVLMPSIDNVLEQVPPLLPYAQDKVVNNAAGVRCHLILPKVRNAG